MISYRRATVTDRAELYDLIREYFQKNEPFNQGWINLDPVPEDIDLSLKSLSDGTSFVAVNDENNVIVGACLTGVDSEASTREMLEESERTNSQKYAEYLRLYVEVDRRANIFERFQIPQAFHVLCLVVNSNFSGQSIGTTLVDKSFGLAQTLGYQMCSINCSSYHTEKIAKKLEMEFVSEIAMSEIKDQKGSRLVFTSEPHTHIRTYVKRF